MDSGIFRGMKLVGMKGSTPSTSAPKRAEPMPVTKKEMEKPPKPAMVGETAPKKKGRPNMKEAKKQVRKAQMSSLDMFIESKPTKAKVRDYLEARVKQLKEDE
jgi:hypothetical protein